MNPISNVIASRELLWSLTQRELQTKYRRSFLGWSWSMLNPLANVAMYGFVFGILFGAKAPEGINSELTGFVYFLLCALIPWNFFSMIINTGMTSISGNSGLVRRVAFPREVLVLSNVGHAIVQFLIELSILITILLIAGSPLVPFLPFAILLMILLAMFGTGFALALSTLSVYFKDMSYLWAILLQLWFFITPIVYPPSLLSDLPTTFQQVLRLNPMVHFVAAFRDVLYHASFPSLGRVLVLALSSIITLSAGWLVFLRLGRRLPEEV